MKTLLVILTWALGAWASTYQLLPVTGADFAPDAPATVQALVRSAVIQAGHTPTDAQASLQLQTRLMSLGQSIIVVCETQENGKVIQSAQFKASSPDELDVVIARTVQAALTGKPAETTAEVGRITDQEQNEIRKRRESRNYTSLGLGPALLHGMDNSNMAYMVHSGYIWEVGRHGAITLQSRMAFTFDDWALHEAFLIGGRFYFTASSVSPFAGAGLGLGLGWGDQFRFGFATGASAGVVFFRTSSTQLELAVYYETLFDSRDDGHPAGKAGAYLAINY